jgi:NADH-quinone oxidoreductase subunit N
VFRAAVDGGLGWLAVVMAVNVVIALYYYLVWAALLFARTEEEAVRTAAPVQAGRTPPPLSVAIGMTFVLAVVLSVVPQLVLQVLTGPVSLTG